MALRVDEWRLKMTEGVTRVLDKLKGGADGTSSRFVRMQDRINAGFAQMKAGGAQAGAMFKGIGTGVKQGLVDQFGSVLPGHISSLMPQITAMGGPLLVVGGIAAGIGAALYKGIEAAEAYGVPFRELRNLNLDKTKAELDAVNDRVLGLAFDKGLDPTKLISGVYDIQSTIGQFGPEVENMVADVGVAARALNMDFGQAVSGVGKALVQFKLPLSDVNKLIESNAKTVQVGVVTFDELSKVQTEYAGAAASVNQQVDTANKVFALLTTNTKNADIAATMTKATFQDLGKADTIAGLKKIGVSVFDANGHMRQTDDILRDLVPKFAKMTDQTFANLKEEIGGSEGLRGLLDMTKASGSEVLRVLDSFDGTKFNLKDAISQASGDLDIVNDQISNKLSTAWVELGQAVMPFWMSVKQALAEILTRCVSWIRSLQGVATWFKDIYDKSALVRGLIQSSMLGLKQAWELVVTSFKVTLNSIITPIKAIGLALTGDFSGAWDALKDGAKSTFDAVSGGVKNMAGNFKSALHETLKGPAPKVNVDLVPNMPKTPEVATVPGAAGSPVAGPEPTLKNDPYAGLFKGKKDKDGLKDGASTVTGGGNQVRNVTVNIRSLIEQFIIHGATPKDAAGNGELRRIINQEIIAAVRGSEAALANS